MKKSEREQTRDWVNLQRAKERNLKLRKKEEEDRKLQWSNYYLAKNNNKKSKSILELFKIKPDQFWNAIENKAPKLLDKNYITQLHIISLLQHQRPIEDWEPRGKGRDTIFNSLCSHLLAKFPTPQFLWSGFWETEIAGWKKISRLDTNICPIIQTIVHVARGESFAKMCKSGDFPVTLTNKQCHQFLASNSDISFITALRQTQIKTYGGDARLLKVLMKRDICKSIDNIANETFLDSVIAWFSKNPMLDLDQLNPIMDYIWQRRRQDRSFSMKGRSAMALIRAMQEWHDDLAKRQITHGKEYRPSGFKPGHWEFKHRTSDGNYIVNIYEIVEILNSKELHAEGKTLHHCVLSYSWSIENGSCSIWSLRFDGERAVTIEVRNRSVVQVRGKYNRQATAEEFKFINNWAQDNKLSVSASRW